MFSFVLAVLAAGSSADATNGPADEVSCPAEIILTERVAAVPKGWTPKYGEVRHKLSGVGFFSGPPEELAALVNDDELSTKEGLVAVWHLPAAKSRYWLACYYQGTATTLRRPLPPEIGLCRVTYDRKGEGTRSLEVKSMICERLVPSVP